MYQSFHPYVSYAKRQWFTHKRKRETNIRCDYLYFYMVRGFFTYEVNGVHGTLSAGEGLLIPPGYVYTIGLNYQELSVFNVVNFDLEGEDYPRPNLGPIPAEEFTSEHKLTRTMPPFDKVRHYVGIEELGSLTEEMLSRYMKREDNYIDFISTLMKLYLMECETKNLHIQKPRDMLTLVEKYLQEHYKESITNQQLADALSYHPYYISATIKKMTGMTLREYILNFRLEKAKLLLRESLMSVTEISVACGFPSHSYFSMTFSRAFGITPSKYRQKHQYQVY